MSTGSRHERVILGTRTLSSWDTSPSEWSGREVDINTGENGSRVASGDKLWVDLQVSTFTFPRRTQSLVTAWWTSALFRELRVLDEFTASSQHVSKSFVCHQSNRTQKLIQTKKFDRNPSPHVKAQDTLADDFLGPQRKTMVIYWWAGWGEVVTMHRRMDWERCERMNPGAKGESLASYLLAASRGALGSHLTI